MAFDELSEKAAATMPQWRFAPIPDNMVAPDVTQRDQFNDGNVDLVESLVREAVQNSTDQATSNDPVILRFDIKTLDVQEAPRLRSLLEPLRPHCETCRLDVSGLDGGAARVLVVEDFNTTGLVGRVDDHDDGNFAGFWRRHGGSNKDASKGGSHGLGKLVFSASSSVGALFGHTVRHDDNRSLLLGQAVLNNHRINGKRLPAHGFWTPTAGGDQIQMPSEDSEIIHAMGKLLGFRRRGEAGLSVAVPLPVDEIGLSAIEKAVITHYFFPILRGSLIVEVGAKSIDRTTFHRVATELDALDDNEKRRLTFIEEIVAAIDNQPDFVLYEGLEALRGDTDLDDDQLEKMREALRNDTLVSVRVPLTLKPKSDADTGSHIDLYLKRKPDGMAPWALFARNNLVLPGESRLSFREQALGAVIAQEEQVCRILRDAENPAHTQWNAQEKLKKNWRYGPATVRDIRLSLQALYRKLTADMRVQYKDLLQHVISIPDPKTGKPRGSKRRTPPIEPPPSKPRLFKEERIEGGFRLKAGPGAKDREYPVCIRIRVAYDVLAGNPFKSHDPLDFDFDVKRRGSLDLAASGIRFISSEANVIVMDCLSPDFELIISGFDPNRDLIIDPRVIE